MEKLIYSLFIVMGILDEIIQDEINGFLGENRELGVSLSDKSGSKTVAVYRAVDEGVETFKDKDFVTLSREFAVVHAEHGVVADFEPNQVIMAEISTEDLYETGGNANEYFYSGPEITGKVIYKTKGIEEFEGYDELDSSDFLAEGLGDWLKGKANVLKQKLADFKKGAVREKYETILAARILLKMIGKRDASPEEVKFLKSQAVDLTKVIGLLGLQAVPGGNATVMLLNKLFSKYNIPFSFYPNSHKKGNNMDVLQKAFPQKGLSEEAIKIRLQEIDERLKELG